MHDPYSPHAIRLMEERFPDISPGDRLRAFVLAEPEREYEKSFQGASLKEKKDMLYDQIEYSADMAVRLEAYFRAHTIDLWEATSEELFTRLSQVAFETTDNAKIEELYARNQRRGFRLAIINFIDELPVLKQYKREFEKDKRATSQELLKQTFEGDIDVEVSPLGVTMILDENDYKKIEERDTTNGITIDTFTISPELRVKVAIINRDKFVSQPEKMQQTKEHELKHVIYSNFFEEILSEADPLDAALAEAKNEIIAHTASNNLDANFANNGFGAFMDRYLNIVEKVFREDEAFSVEDKARAYSYSWNRLRAALGQVRGLNAD